MFVKFRDHENLLTLVKFKNAYIRIFEDKSELNNFIKLAAQSEPLARSFELKKHWVVIIEGDVVAMFDDQRDSERLIDDLSKALLEGQIIYDLRDHNESRKLYHELAKANTVI